MNRKTLIAAVVAGALTAILLWPRESQRASGVLPHDVYVWQRAWTEAVDDAIAEHATRFTELAALNAEVIWKNKQPRVARVALHYETLRNAERPVGLALRIGPYAGPFSPEDQRTGLLADLAASLLAEAATNQLRVAELQIDFDCAESKLDGYRVWVDAIKRRVHPVPVTITVLPAWLKRSAFKHLIDSADGYVLQVHSLARPRDAGAPFSLCDPAEAHRAVERAGRLGKPFRVALPTYGYHIAFDAKGRFAGLSAEGPAILWPEGTQLREVRADPQAMAELVASWNADRPHALTGLIWYRLPVAGDSLNWSWPTLGAVMDGRVPHADLRIETRHPQPELVEIDLVNAGQARHDSPVRVELSWRKAKLVAADGLQGFELAETGLNGVQFSSSRASAEFEAGQRRTIGWIRMDGETELKIELQRNDN